MRSLPPPKDPDDADEGMDAFEEEATDPRGRQHRGPLRARPRAEPYERRTAGPANDIEFMPVSPALANERPAPQSRLDTPLFDETRQSRFPEDHRPSALPRAPKTDLRTHARRVVLAIVILVIVSILGLAFAFATDRWATKRERSGEHGAATPSFLSCS